MLVLHEHIYEHIYVYYVVLLFRVWRKS